MIDLKVNLIACGFDDHDLGEAVVVRVRGYITENPNPIDLVLVIRDVFRFQRCVRRQLVDGNGHDPVSFPGLRPAGEFRLVSVGGVHIASE